MTRCFRCSRCHNRCRPCGIPSGLFYHSRSVRDKLKVVEQALRLSPEDEDLLREWDKLDTLVRVRTSR